MNLRVVVCSGGLLFLCLGAVYAQEFRGTISGQVTDPSGAPVAEAQVTVNETKTGTRQQTASNTSGGYSVPFLAPGDYDIEVTAQGFKRYVRQAVHVGAGDRAVIDVPLQLGDQVQTVSVTADVPIVNGENATIGQAITTKEVENLPLNGRTPLTLAALSIGVTATGQPGLIHPFDLGGAAGWSIAGTPSQVNEILVNGSPDATWDGRLAYSPPSDAVARGSGEGVRHGRVVRAHGRWHHQPSPQDRHEQPSRFAV
jgi:hypothetical protein